MAISNRRFLILTIGSQKCFSLVCIVLGIVFLREDGTFLDWASGWDAAHYLKLAEDGYTHDDASCAFYPLFPLLIRWLARIFAGNFVWAGLVLSNTFSVAAFFLFYRLVLERFGSEISRFALLALLAFPTAMFFSVIYTESLFFLELMMLFWALQKNRIGVACAAAFLMPLTRAVGVFGIVVLLWHWYEQRRKATEFGKAHRWLFAVICGLLGWFAFLALMRFWTGDPFESFKAQRFYMYQPSIANIFNVKKWGSAFLNWGSIHGFVDSSLDRTCFVVVVVCFYGIWRLSPTYFVWTLCGGIVPAMSSCFFSYVRYTLCVFPLFILAAVYFSAPERRWIFWYYFGFLLFWQGFLMIRYAGHWWAG